MTHRSDNAPIKCIMNYFYLSLWITDISQGRIRWAISRNHIKYGIFNVQLNILQPVKYMLTILRDALHLIKLTTTCYVRRKTPIFRHYHLYLGAYMMRWWKWWYVRCIKSILRTPNQFSLAFYFFIFLFASICQVATLHSGCDQWMKKFKAVDS